MGPKNSFNEVFSNSRSFAQILSCVLSYNSDGKKEKNNQRFLTKVIKVKKHVHHIKKYRRWYRQYSDVFTWYQIDTI